MGGGGCFLSGGWMVGGDCFVGVFGFVDGGCVGGGGCLLFGGWVGGRGCFLGPWFGFSLSGLSDEGSSGDKSMSIRRLGTSPQMG